MPPDSSLLSSKRRALLRHKVSADRTVWSRSEGPVGPYRRAPMLMPDKSVRAVPISEFGWPRAAAEYRGHQHSPCIGRFERDLHMALGGEVMNLIWLRLLDDP